MSSFNKGDVVKLLSGGCLMTIASVFTEEETAENRIMLYRSLMEIYPEENTFYICIWFNEKNELKQEVFPESVLTSDFEK